ncbi:flagellar basal-body rod protein FlgC, partial [human gut metagenome]
MQKHERKIFMAFLNSINIVGSALTAERFKTNIILQNIANQTT